MNKKIRSLIFIINTLLCFGVFSSMAIFMHNWGPLLQVIIYTFGGVSLVLGIIFALMKKDPLLKSLFVLTVFLLIILAVLITFNQIADLNDYTDDTAKIDRIVEIINLSGNFGKIVYIFLQILQVVILPIPAVIVYVPGAVIWGPVVATLLATVGVIIGSVISFYIGRIFGKRVAIWIIGKEQTEKYCEIIGKNGKLPFVVMQILPFFPDDILCIIAGLSSMSFLFFILTVLIIRPIIIAMYCYFGSGVIIPFSGWGIPVWIAIFAVIITVSILYFKNQKKIETFIAKKFKRKTKNK